MGMTEVCIDAICLVRHKCFLAWSLLCRLVFYLFASSKHWSIPKNCVYHSFSIVIGIFFFQETNYTSHFIIDENFRKITTAQSDKIRVCNLALKCIHVCICININVKKLLMLHSKCISFDLLLVHTFKHSHTHTRSNASTK